ncbi:MAG TPA: hypothetical protein VNH18_25175 [Bryobacteraceae bacterium]|nr:hypothetical protein [Bryobacteraceae bacterium]
MVLRRLTDGARPSIGHASGIAPDRGQQRPDLMRQMGYHAGFDLKVGVQLISSTAKILCIPQCRNDGAGNA